MNKLLLILGVTALVASFTACSKTCTCTNRTTGNSTTVNLKDAGVKKCSDLKITTVEQPEQIICR